MKNILKILLIALVLRLLFSFFVWHPDVNNHIDWGIRFWQYGASKFYAPETNVWSYTWPNQPPGTIYIFAGVRKLFEFLFNLFSIAHFQLHFFPGSWLLFFEKSLYPALLKLPSILSDIGIGYLLYKWTGKKLAAILWLVNPVIWYNSTIWGQTDAIVNFLVLLSFYLLLQKRLNLSLLSFAISLYIKASLLIFVPIWLIFALGQKYKIHEYVVSVIYSLITIVLLSLPFSHGNSLIWIYNLYVNKVFVQQLHLITANAFNLWSFVAGIHERPDSLPFFGFTYQLWGFVLFTISYLPLLWRVYKRGDKQTLTWVLALSGFASFILLTNMHERYLYPLFPYLTILAVTSSIDLFVYWSISLLSLLNLYNFWWYPRIDFMVNLLSFGDRIMPRILGLINFGLFGYLYSKFLRQKPTLNI